MVDPTSRPGCELHEEIPDHGPGSSNRDPVAWIKEREGAPPGGAISIELNKISIVLNDIDPSHHQTRCATAGLHDSLRLFYKELGNRTSNIPDWHIL